MQPSLVLQKIARGETVITAKAGYTDPELVELIASAGFDAVWICLEHKRMDPSMVYALIQACRLGGADALIRVKPSNYTEVLQLIEAGARGILLPRVVHPDEVRAVVAAMKFPPLGFMRKRILGASRRRSIWRRRTGKTFLSCKSRNRRWCSTLRKSRRCRAWTFFS